MQALGKGQKDAETPRLGRAAQLVGCEGFDILTEVGFLVCMGSRESKNPLPTLRELVIMLLLIVKPQHGEWHDPRGWTRSSTACCR